MRLEGRSQGFVLVVTLLLLIFFSTLAQRFAEDFFNRTRTFKVILDRGQARLLCYDALALAMAAISPKKTAVTKKENNESFEKTDPESQLAKNNFGRYYYKLLKVLNKPQVFILTKKTDGIDAAIGFHVVSEDGKIDLNSVYDFKSKNLVPEWAKLLDRFNIKTGSGKEAKKVALGQALRNFFAKKVKLGLTNSAGQVQIYDIRELELEENLSILAPVDFSKQFELKVAELNDKSLRENRSNNGEKTSEIYYKKATSVDTANLLIGDLFTCSDLKKLNPILLSPVIRKGLGIGEFVENPEENEKNDKLLEFCKKIDSSLPASPGWGSLLEDIKKLWKERSESGNGSKEPNSKSGTGYNLISNLLCQEISPKFLTITCWAKYGLCEFRIVTLCQRVGQLDAFAEKPDSLERQNICTFPGYRVVKVYESY